MGLILSAQHLKWQLFTTHLGVSFPSKWSDHTLPSISISSSFLFFTIPISFPSYDHVFLFSLFWFLCYLSFHLCSLIFTPHLILCFSLCPLEVNLHTYLTTWLSLCPMGIFFGFLTIIVNPKNINKRVTHKMCNPKIKSHQVAFYHLVFLKVHSCPLVDVYIGKELTTLSYPSSIFLFHFHLHPFSFVKFHFLHLFYNLVEIPPF